MLFLRYINGDMPPTWLVIPLKKKTTALRDDNDESEVWIVDIARLSNALYSSDNVHLSLVEMAKMDRLSLF